MFKHNKKYLYENPTTLEMEVRIANYFHYRQNLIVPNISWGFDIHECDMLVVTQAGYLYEVEIKISKPDLKKDVLKKHKHLSNKIKMLYFAIPEKLSDCVEYIPSRAGILILDKYGELTCTRKAEIDKTALKIHDYERHKITRLGALRIWGLKKKVIKLLNSRKKK